MYVHVCEGNHTVMAFGRLFLSPLIALTFRVWSRQLKGANGRKITIPKAMTVWLPSCMVAFMLLYSLAISSVKAPHFVWQPVL
jgi:hypothetical protein